MYYNLLQMNRNRKLSIISILKELMTSSKVLIKATQNIMMNTSKKLIIIIIIIMICGFCRCRKIKESKKTGEIPGSCQIAKGVVKNNGDGYANHSWSSWNIQQEPGKETGRTQDWWGWSWPSRPHHCQDQSEIFKKSWKAELMCRLLDFGEKTPVETDVKSLWG